MTRFHESRREASRGRCAPRPQATGPWRCFAGHTSSSAFHGTPTGKLHAGRFARREGSLRGMPATTGCGRAVHAAVRRSSRCVARTFRYYESQFELRGRHGRSRCRPVKNLELEGHERLLGIPAARQDGYPKGTRCLPSPHRLLGGTVENLPIRARAAGMPRSPRALPSSSF